MMTLLESDSFTIRLDWNLVLNLMVAGICLYLLVWLLKWVLSKVKT